ncbi:dodecin family protein [Candidatus Magnetomonas plexicatena]|uniref:dodecin family protein n=1 Tax=Candidatus Magnetomonas plexicatena TaxID=2552947 RepID=UPI001C75C1F4|nr:dodecin domain-containing protein [Nitrospirales bacterium LBB_01]
MVSKIVILVGESPNSWEDATTNLIKEAQTSLRGITRIMVTEFDVKMKDNMVDVFRVKAEVAFKVDKT